MGQGFFDTYKRKCAGIPRQTRIRTSITDVREASAASLGQWRFLLEMAIMAILEGAMRSANIAELRNRLTQYLREVRHGEEIIVRDRQRPIAKIVPFTVDEEDAELQTLIAEGLARPPARPLPASFWKQRRPNIPLRRVVKAVRADRDER